MSSIPLAAVSHLTAGHSQIGAFLSFELGLPSSIEATEPPALGP